jgi:eukaryotic-like serine/threonine-protein kinase
MARANDGSPRGTRSSRFVWGSRVGITAAEDTPELVKYALREQIGHGGMATVYRAEDRRLGRDVAVKLIHPHLRGNREVAARFVSEARAVAKLKHPNIVEVYDISDEAEAERYLVVELIEGPTLRQLLEQRAPLPPEIAAIIGVQLSAALHHAHGQQIVHRDVKPENVLLSARGRASRPGHTSEETPRAIVKLTDFGIAKVLDAHGVTSTGQVLGSPAHMAPEQIEGTAVGPRADVFGLGVLLYEAMVGKLPFDGANPAQVLRKVLDGEHEAAVRLRPQVGARWSALLDRALANKPEDRFSSIEALGAELRSGLEQLGFRDGQAELDSYLSDPDAYDKHHAERVAEALVAAGERARAEGEVALAADCFNRALSYRPGDPHVIARVSAAARRERMKRVVRSIGLGAGLLGGALAAWMAWPSTPLQGAPSSPVPIAAPTAPPKASPPAAKAPVPALSAKDPGTPSAGASASAAALPVRRAPPLFGKHITPKEPVQVRVKVIGAKGGDLYVDGVKKDDWLHNPFVSLKPGTHSFKFELKDDRCCISPAVQKAILPDLEGQEITLTVTYREARLQVDSAPPGVLSCGTFFTDPLEVPGSRSVRIGSLEAQERCYFTPHDQSAFSRWSDSVRLTAGQTTRISVP